MSRRKCTTKCPAFVQNLADVLGCGWCATYGKFWAGEGMDCLVRDNKSLNDDERLCKEALAAIKAVRKFRQKKGKKNVKEN
jgi:hypothetical protein